MKKLRKRITAIFLTSIIVSTLLMSIPVATTAAEQSLFVYGQYTTTHASYGIDGYGDLLYYDDGNGICHIVRVTVPEGADPDIPGDEMAPRTFQEVATYDFKADCGWSGSDKAEFYVGKYHIYYGSNEGIEKWARNADGTFGEYKGRLNIPVLNKGETLAYDADDDIWYTCTSSRAVHSFEVGVDTDWQHEFTYPSYGGGQGYHGGMEFVGGYLWVSETKTDCIGQWQYTGNGEYNGWQEVNRFLYSYPSNLQGLGFGPLGHFWAASGGWKVKGKYQPIYEIGGGLVQVTEGFTWTPEPQNEGSLVNFTDTSTSWPDVIAGWRWEFGDDRTSNKQNPAHAYGDDGTYTVVLTITTSNGYKETVSHDVGIIDVPPVAEAGQDQIVDEGEIVSFSGSITDPGWLDTHTIEWDLGDSSLGSGTLTPTHAYGDNGFYQVTLTVTDNDDELAADTDTLAVTVLNVAPVVDVGPDLAANDKVDITFSGSFTDPGWLDTHTIEWEFGDGTTAEGTLNPVHAYEYRGTYSVTLTVTDKDGGVGTDTLTVYIPLGMTVTVTPDEVPAPSFAQFIPLQDIPLQDIPLQDIPLQDIPLQDIAMGSSPLQDIPLQDIPLQDISWESILLGTPLQDIPLQDITLNDVLLAGIPLQDITLADIFLAGAPLQDIPLQDILIIGTPLQDIPLQDIPLQDITWEDFLMGTPLEGADLATTTLGDVAEEDIPLQDIPLQDILLAGIPLQDIPLQDIPLQDIDIADTPLQDIPLQDIPLQDITWEEYLMGTPLEGADPATTTLGDVAGEGIPLQDITLYDALMALIPLQDIPWESIPLQDIPLQEILVTENSVTYAIKVANYDDVDAEDVFVTHTLPDSFEYLAGTTTIDGAPADDPTIEGQSLTWGPFTVLTPSELLVGFKATAATTLGTYFSNVSASCTSLEIPPVANTAPVTVIDTFEDNDSWQQAHEISADRLYLSYISSDTDVDWYSIPVPVIKGTMITVYLSHLPADYDLVLFAGAEDLPTDIPLQDIPLQDIPLQDIPLQDIPLQDIPLQDIPLQDIPLQDIPLQDIPLQDIPLQDISIERGIIDETTGDKVVNEAGDYYILVSGYNGANSNQPYLLRIEITTPPVIEPFSRDLPDQGAAGTVYEPYGADAETLIVTNQQRLEQYYGSDAIYGTNALRDKLQAFADLPYVKGVILPVENDVTVWDAYNAWDTNANDPEAANAVAAAIRAEIGEALVLYPGVWNVVIVGSDEIVPFRRVPDEVYLSNESTYAARAHLESSSALYASLALGYILTDDYYVDMAPVPWMGRELYVPDYPVGRLVENPAEIIGMLAQFEANNGVLEASTALVTGYDFLTDGAYDIAAALVAEGLMPEELISEEWTEPDLTALLLADPAYDLTSLNAHCNHWAVGPPVGNPFYSDQILLSYLEGKLIFSMGCHAGLNIDDSVSQPDSASEPGDWSLDLPQAFAQKAAWFVGNTGYGYGDSDIVALSEELMRNFTEELGAADSVSVGQALVNAKQTYFLNMGSYGPFDEKIMIESTLYGLPMYQVNVAGISPLTEALAGTPLTESLAVTASRLVNFNPVDTLTEYAQLIETITDDGVFFSADGETQFIAYRPIEPRINMEISYPGQVAHGALFTGGTYMDIDGFDPVIARPIDDQSLYEPQVINEAWYPAKLQTILSLQTPDGALQTLAVVPGQFITTAADTIVTGTERLYTALDYDVYYSTSSDYTAPIIEQTDITISGEEGDFTAFFTVKAIDANTPDILDDGIVKRVAVTWTYTSEDTTWETINLYYDSTTEMWTGVLPGLNGAETDFIVQAVDDAGNVGLSAAKGFFFTPVHVEAGNNQTVDEGDTVSFQGSYDAIVESPVILWNFGDGSTAEGTLNPTHVYADNGLYTVTLKVTDEKGSSGWDSLLVTVNNVPPAVLVEEITVQYSDPVEFVGSFTDPGLGDTHTYHCDFYSDPIVTIWGNLKLTLEWLDWLDEYPAPGIYAATLTVRDDDGGEGQGTCSMNVTREDTMMTYTGDLEGQYADPVTVSAILSELDDSVGDLSGKTITFTIGIQSTSAVTDSTGAASASITLDQEPGDYIVTAEFAGDTYYLASSDWAPFTIHHTARSLKTKALADLESLETGDSNIDKEIDRLEQRLQNSLETNLWADDLRLVHNLGKDVFQEEWVVAGHLESIMDNVDPAIAEVFQSVTADMVKADEILAETAIEDAQNRINEFPSVDQEVITHMESATEELAAGCEMAEANPAGAIICFMHAWEHAQQVILLLQ